MYTTSTSCNLATSKSLHFGWLLTDCLIVSNIIVSNKVFSHCAVPLSDNEYIHGQSTPYWIFIYMYTKASVLPIPSNLIENQMKRRKNSRNYIVNLRFFVLRRCLSNRVLTERQNLIGENDYIIFTTHQYHNVHASCNAHPHNLW